MGTQVLNNDLISFIPFNCFAGSVSSTACVIVVLPSSSRSVRKVQEVRSTARPISVRELILDVVTGCIPLSLLPNVT